MTDNLKHGAREHNVFVKVIAVLVALLGISRDGNGRFGLQMHHGDAGPEARLALVLDGSGGEGGPNNSSV